MNEREDKHVPVQVSFEDSELDFYECRACFWPWPCETATEALKGAGDE